MYDREDISNKNLLICTLLAFFFGSIGLHRFYVGKWKTGLIYIAGSSLPLFSPFLYSILGIEDIFQAMKLTIAVGILSLCVGVAVIYDVYAMYSESFFDKHGKILLSESVKNEYIGVSYTEQFIHKLDTWIVSLSFIAVFILYIVIANSI